MSAMAGQQAETNLTGDVLGPVFSGTFSGPVTIVLNTSPQLQTPVWQHVNWAASMQCYQQELVRQYGTMQLFGMARPIPLDTLFIDVYLLDQPSAWRRHTLEELHTLGLTGHDQDLRSERQPGIELVRCAQRLFIFGKPGAGKTTFLKYLAHQALHGRLNALPIFVSLKEWADIGGNLMAFMERQFAICGFPHARAFLDATLTAGQALVMFDGLDEVPVESNARSRMIAAICDFARQYGQSRVAITCRTAATDYTFEGFCYCEIADFSPAQIEAFAANWFRTQPARLFAFRRGLTDTENKGLLALARTPLLLALLCLTFDQTMQFPLRHAELYEQAIDALLQKWDASRDIQRDTLYRQLSLSHKRQLLAELAAQSFQDGQLFMRRELLCTRITAYLQRVPGMPADADANLILQAIEAQHGLIVECATNVYRFSHLTFQEYFTARYIVSKPHLSQFEALVGHAHDLRWRELLLLLVGMLESESAMLLFQIWTTQLKRMAGHRLLRTLIMSIVQWSAPQHSVQGYQDRVTLLLLACGRSFLLASTLARMSASSLAVDLAIERTLDLQLALARFSTHTIATTLAGGLDDASGHAFFSARNLAHCIASTLALSPALDGDLNSDLTRASTLASEFANDHTGDLGHASALVGELTHTLTHALVVFVSTILTQRLNDYRTAPMSLITQGVWWYTMRWAVEMAATVDDLHAADQLRTQINQALVQLVAIGIDTALAQGLLAALPAPADERVVWQPFVDHTHELLLIHKNIADMSSHTAESAQLLDQYLASTLHLVECLKLAQIADRDAVFAELLVADNIA